jgi:signal transduction histidine kinase
MFFNLAWRNSKRSRNENLIYFLTMVTAVAAFYIVLSLGAQDVIRFLSSLESDAVERLLTNLLPTVYVCALLFVFFLVVFANKYQLECRSRELGLYLMFGMTKTRLFTQIMTEGLITSLVALLGGLICGGFLSEVISLATARLVGHGVIAHQSSFSLSAVFFTILGFLIIQCVALFILCGKLFKKEVHQLLYGEMGKKQHTGSTHGSLLSLVIGTAVLLVAYWVVIEHFMTGGGVMLLVAVLLGIVGTILFIRGIARLLSIVAASNKRKATNGLYVFTLRQLHENVVYKYISISVASILMMLTIMFIANGSATIMSHGNELTRTSAVYDFTVMGEEQNVEQYLSDDQMRVYVANLNRMETGNMKRPASGEMKSFVDWSVLRKEIVQNLPEGVIDPATQEAASYEFGSHQPAALNLLGFIDTGSVSPYMLPVAWLANPDYFINYVALIIFVSFATLAIPLAISIRKRNKTDAIFRRFLLEPDDTNEYLLCEAVPAVLRPYICELGQHLRTQQEYINEQKITVTDYQHYIENWVHEIKKPLSLMTLLLDNRKDEMSPLVHTRMLYVRDHTRQDIEQILYFSRLGATHKDYFFEPLSILEICREAVEDNLTLLEEAGFSVEYTENDAQVISDKKGLMFILGQIISNSVKYTGNNPAPRLLFSIADSADNEQISLSMKDNGTSIPLSDLPFVFDKGFTGDTGSYLSRSTGMGLYLVQKMATDLSITVELKNNSCGGTTVTLTFPKVERPFGR